MLRVLPADHLRAARVGVTVGVTALALATLGACSSSDAAKPKAGASSAPVVAASIQPTTPQHPIPSEDQIVEVPKLRETIQLTGCSAADGGWAGTGTAKNPDSKEETYKILVFFTDKYSRTIDSATTEVKVGAGETANWTAAAQFTPPEGTQCVLRGLSEA